MRHSVKKGLSYLLTSAVLGIGSLGVLSSEGCGPILIQDYRTVTLAPIFPVYQLNKELEGKAYVLMAESGIGSESYRKAVSDSLAIIFQKKYPSKLEVYSYTDFSNILSSREWVEEIGGLDGQKQKITHNGIALYREMQQQHQDNATFNPNHLVELNKLIGADYIIQPSLISFNRQDKERFDLNLFLDIKFLRTKATEVKASFEIWDTITGFKIFDAGMEQVISQEAVKEQSPSLEESLEKGFEGIIEEMPGVKPEEKEEEKNKWYHLWLF